MCHYFAPVEINESDATVNLDVGGWVCGVVLRCDGSPAEGIAVAATGQDTPIGLGFGSCICHTAASGAFMITGLRADKAYVISSPGCEAVRDVAAFTNGVPGFNDPSINVTPSAGLARRF